LKPENLSLTFRKNPKKSPLPWREGMEGRGNWFLLSTPTLALPHRRGRENIGEISNIFG